MTGTVPVLGCQYLKEKTSMLTVHHLGRSQSERIVWLCEELKIPYELKRYDRDPKTRLAPADYKALHPLGAAPVITDGNIVLAESGAIMEYIIARHGDGRFAVAPNQPNYPDYVYWFHSSNGSLQPSIGSDQLLARAGVAKDSPMIAIMKNRQNRVLSLVESRLAQTPYLAGNDLTAADIMTVFTLTTMRYFAPFDLTPYPPILAYLQRIGARPAYRAAMQKGDPDMAPLLT